MPTQRVNVRVNQNKAGYRAGQVVGLPSAAHADELLGSAGEVLEYEDLRPFVPGQDPSLQALKEQRKAEREAAKIDRGAAKETRKGDREAANARRRETRASQKAEKAAQKAERPAEEAPEVPETPAPVVETPVTEAQG